MTALLDLGRLLAAIRRNRWRILALGLLGLLLGLGLVQLTPKPYESTATVLATGIPITLRADDGVKERTPDTEAQLIRSDALLKRVAGQLGVSRTELIDRIRISAPPNTRVLEFTFTADTAALARRGAETVAAEFVAVRRAAISLHDSTSGVRTEVVRHAPLPGAPTNANAEVPPVSGLFGGLVAGLCWGTARDRWRPRVRDAEQVSEAIGLPVAATLGTHERLRELAFEVRLSGASRVLVIGIGPSALTTSVGKDLRAMSRYTDDPPELDISTNRPSSAYVLSAAQQADLVLIVVELGRNTLADLADGARLLSRTARSTAVVLAPPLERYGRSSTRTRRR